MSLLQVPVMAGDLGPVVLAGEADRSSVTQLNEVFTTQVSARTRCMTIDTTNLRSIGQTTGQALILAALIVLVQGGRAMLGHLVNPRKLVFEVLNRSRVTEMVAVRDRTSGETAPDGSMDSGFSERAM